MQNLEKIEIMWAEDCKIDKLDLIGASYDIPKLHSKYFQLLNKARSKLNILEAALAKLTLLKNDYYTNMMDKDTLKELNWPPNKRLILKADLPIHLAADDDIIEITRNIQVVKQTIDFLESIIRHINNRNFIIKNIIEYEKFTQGSA